MSKTKKQIILFIIIVLIGVGYTVNEYIIAPNKLLNQQKEIQMQAEKQKLILLKSKRAEAESLKLEIEKLKQAAKAIEDVTVADIDTPQLIFDFYSSCVEYGIKGENLVFQLASSNTKVEAPVSGAVSKPIGDVAKQSTDSTGTIVNTIPPSPTTTTTTEDTNKSKTTTDLLKLTIELKVSGDKDKVEKYIRSLNTLTTRKINVKNIKLAATVDQVADNTTNPNVLTQVVTAEEPITDKVTADIIFNQYVYSDGKNVIRPSAYSFYDENTGFSRFSDMFK